MDKRLSSDMWCAPLSHEYDFQWNNLLWVGLVQCSIHTHSDPERPQFPVLLDSSQDGSQPCSHQVWGPEGHDGADMLNGDAVVEWRGQVQVREDVSGVLHTIFIPEKDGERDGAL